MIAQVGVGFFELRCVVFTYLSCGRVCPASGVLARACGNKGNYEEQKSQVEAVVFASPLRSFSRLLTARLFHESAYARVYALPDGYWMMLHLRAGSAAFTCYTASNPALLHLSTQLSSTTDGVMFHSWEAWLNGQNGRGGPKPKKVGRFHML